MRRHNPGAYAKRRYHERAARGLCVRCGKPPTPGRCMCVSCNARVERWKVASKLRDETGAPKKFRPWMAREAAQLRELYAAAVPVEEIATRLGRSVKAIVTQARWLGITRPPRQRWWTAERVARLRELHADGMLLSGIAAELGVTPPAVHAKAVKLGLRRGSGPNHAGYRAALRCACGLALPCNGCLPGIEAYASARQEAA